MDREDIVLQKIKELIVMDLSKLKYTEVPHILLIVTKIVYADKCLDEKIQKDLVVKIVNILVDKSEMAPLIKKAIKDIIPNIIDKYIEIDNGSFVIKIRTYGKFGKMWIKIRMYLDHKILGI